jgi:urea transport system permease protein
MPDTAEDVINNNLMRSGLDTALAALKLFSGEQQVRLQAVATLIKRTQRSLAALVGQGVDH